MRKKRRKRERMDRRQNGEKKGEGTETRKR